MHPVIRITTFLIIAVLLARAHPMQMGWVLCVIGLTFVFESGKGLSAAVKLLWRVRWLLLSILMIYVWMPVGTFSESLWLAFHRIALLATMLFALQALVLNMQRDDIVIGLYVVLLPLGFIGFSREQLVMRLILTMDSVKQLPTVLELPVATNSKTNSRLKRITERLISAITRILSYSEDVSHDAICIETDNTVPLWQWLVPVLILFIFFTLSW